MDVPGLGLFLWRSLTWAHFLRDLWLGPAPSEVPDLYPGLVEVFGLQRSLGWACSLSDCCLVHAPMEVADLGLPPTVFLPKEIGEYYSA